MSSSTQSMQDQFQKDYDAMIQAAKDYQTAMDEEKQAEDTYKNVILKKLDSITSADQIMVYLQMMVFQSSGDPGNPDSDASIFGIYGDKVGMQGKALQVNSYLTAVHNDLQKMVDSNSKDPEVVHNVAKDLDSILNQFKDNPALQNAMDPTSLANMQQTDLSLRHEIYDATDTLSGYNPDANPDPVTNGYTYHFTYGVDSKIPPDDYLYLRNFADMQKYMKTPGDHDEASEAYKNLSNGFNSDTSMTQTINSALNEKINQLTKFIQTLLGFYENGLLQPSMKLINVAVQNQSKQ